MAPAAPTCTPPAANPAPGTGDCLDFYFFDFFSLQLSCSWTITWPPGNISSTYMEIVQAEFPAPVATSRFASPPNDGVLTPLQDRALVGCTGNGCPRVTVGGFTSLGTPVLDFWALSKTSAPGVPLPDVGNLLIGLPTLQFLTGPPGAPLGVASIPKDCGLLGAAVYTQGGAIDGTGKIALAQALDYVIGRP